MYISHSLMVPPPPSVQRRQLKIKNTFAMLRHCAQTPLSLSRLRQHLDYIPALPSIS